MHFSYSTSPSSERNHTKDFSLVLSFSSPESFIDFVDLKKTPQVLFETGSRCLMHLKGWSSMHIDLSVFWARGSEIETYIHWLENFLENL